MRKLLLTTAVMALLTTPALAGSIGIVSNTRAGVTCDKFDVGGVTYAVESFRFNGSDMFAKALNAEGLGQTVEVLTPADVGYQAFVPQNVLCSEGDAGFPRAATVHPAQ
jgi:hypothetical protein